MTLSEHAALAYHLSPPSVLDSSTSGKLDAETTKRDAVGAAAAATAVPDAGADAQISPFRSSTIKLKRPDEAARQRRVSSPRTAGRLYARFHAL